MMADLVERMEQLRAERVEALAKLSRNTTEMRSVAVKAQAAGHSAYRIAKVLGVTSRTVYLWLKG